MEYYTYLPDFQYQAALKICKMTNGGVDITDACGNQDRIVLRDGHLYEVNTRRMVKSLKEMERKELSFQRYWGALVMQLGPTLKGVKGIHLWEFWYSKKYGVTSKQTQDKKQIKGILTLDVTTNKIVSMKTTETFPHTSILENDDVQKWLKLILETSAPLPSEPISHDSGEKKNSNLCVVCQKPPAGSKTLRCGGCREVSYCSVICQTRHWSDGHKSACAKVKEFTQVNIYAAGRVFVGSRRSSEKSAMDACLKKQETLIKKHTAKVSLFTCTYSQLRECLGKESNEFETDPFFLFPIRPSKDCPSKDCLPRCHLLVAKNLSVVTYRDVRIVYVEGKKIADFKDSALKELFWKELQCHLSK